MSVHFNSSYQAMCPYMNLGTASQSSQMIQEKFNQTCFLIGSFDSKLFNQAVHFEDLIFELSQLKDEFANLKNDPTLSDKEKVIANSTHLAINYFISFYDAEEKEIADIIAKSNNYNSPKEQDTDLACTRAFFATLKQISVLSLQLTHSLFSFKPSCNDDLKSMSDTLATLYSNVGAFAFLNIVNLDMKMMMTNSSEIAMGEHLLITCANILEHDHKLGHFFNRLHNSNRMSSEFSADFLALEQAYHVFASKIGLFLDQKYQPTITDEIKMITAYQNFISKIKLPSTH